MGMKVRVWAHLPGGMGAPYYSGKVDVSTNYGIEEAKERAMREIREVHGNREIRIDKIEALDTW